MVEPGGCGGWGVTAWRIIASDGTVDNLDDTSLEFCRDVAQAFASLGASVRFVRVPVARVAGMPYI